MTMTGQVFTACFAALGHGANDVANSIGPYAAIIGIYNSGRVAQGSPVPLWILVMGGLGIVAGLLLYGYKVIESIGVKLMKVTPARGFAIELSAALVVIIGSGLGIPLSTTHCQVGAETGVGMVEGKGGVNWSLLGQVGIGWLVTLLICGGISGGLFSAIVYGPSVEGYEGWRNASANMTPT